MYLYKKRWFRGKTCTDGTQTTIALHVDGLMVANVCEANLDAFHEYLKEMYKETRVVRGRILDYVGMSFDFTTTGEVKVICVNDILGACENLKEATTPASSILFDVRSNTKASTVYGVHKESGKSHTGCAIVIGDGGPVYNKSSKQKIVIKSSTEAELVGLSDTASQAIHIRNFVIAQGTTLGPSSFTKTI